jgi:hypothetical protein
MGKLIQAITDQYSQLLIGIIEYCLKNMFTDINNGMKYVVVFAGRGPGVTLPEAFEMVKKLSDNVMLPISCIIISFILTYELISMVIDKNNMHEVDSALLARYLFKAAASVFLLSKSYEITMAIFDVGAYLVEEAGKVIVSTTDLGVEDALMDTYINSLQNASLSDLYASAGGLMLAMFTFKIMTVLIIVISYGRLVEMFLMVSVSPVAFATFGNKEWGQIGVNYLKALVALAFQGFLIMVLVGVYTAILEGLTHSNNLPAAVFNLVILSVLFCFSLFKTASLSKQIFTVR